MTDLTTRLTELTADFQFGKLDMLQRMDEIKFTQDSRTLKVENWYDYSAENLHGDCQEIAVKAYRKIRLAEPTLALRFFFGYDSKLFIPVVGIHSFLLANEQGGDSILIDPSLKVVTPYHDSGYTWQYESFGTELYAKLKATKQPLELGPENMTFIGMDSKRSLLYYIGRNTMRDNDDELMLVTHLPCGEVGMSDKRPWRISECPESIRQQAPLFELAYQLEMKARKDLK